MICDPIELSSSRAGTIHDPKTCPLAVPLYADFETEGAVVAKAIQNTYPNAQIGVVYQNDDFGKGYVRGLRAGLGTKASQIVAEASMNFPIRQPTCKVKRSNKR